MDDIRNPDIHSHGFVSAPVNRVVGVLDDPEAVPAILTSLLDAGFAEDKIHVFVGEEGERVLDLAGTHHGWRARMARSLQKLGFESDVFHEADAELKLGHALIGVLTNGSREEESDVAKVLKSHEVHSLHFFGRLEVEDL